MNLKPPDPSPDSASLVKRLAGPSTNKAGLAKDQTEINHIIAEASKGSKFYENEKRKDKDLTERITRILNQRDEALKGVDIRKIESAADNLLLELEAQRDLSQIIVHVDMDAFFANVELLHNPELLGKPFGVGKGVLTTASYEARKYGVRSGMPGFIAQKLCPDLIVVDNNFSRYSDMSRQVMNVFRRYDPNMSAAGCDEGYLNLTEYCRNSGLSADDSVQQMRQVVKEETKLTVSAGIAPNKMLAKICSDKNKPDGQFHLPLDREAIVSFMRDLSIRKIPGIGRVNERLLESIGIKTCGDIYIHRAVISLMDKQFGLHFLLQTYLGIASNVVQPYQRQETKSIGAERTFNPMGDKNRILAKLNEVAEELEKDMESSGWTGRTVTLKFKLDTYQVFTRAKSFDRWISKKEDLYAIGKELLLPELPLKLRLIGLRVTKLKDLRASATTSETIERFFTTVSTDSPSKKHKAEHEEVEAHEIEGECSYLEEAMPGFHEHAEDDAHMVDAGGDDTELEDKLHTTPSITNHRPLVSAPTSSSAGASKPIIENNSSTGPQKLIKPRSTSKIARASDSSSKSVKEFTGDGVGQPEPNKTGNQICPICEKTLETDNNGFNEHIDFCLSRGAIREAQAAAASPRKRSTADDLRSKPKSKRKKEVM